MMRITPGFKKRHTGLVTVEFAVVGLTLLIVVFGCLEIGRLMFTWNTLAEMTRLGARAGAVCPVNSAAATQIATLTRTSKTVLSQKIRDAVKITYLDEDGNEVTNAATPIVFVQARIDAVTYDFLVPGFPALTLPPFQTIRPRESLGVVPGEAQSAC